MDSKREEGCLPGLDVGTMVCMLTQGDGWILKGRTGCVRCATHLRTWKLSSIFSCPAYSDVRQKHASLFQQAFSVSDLFTKLLGQTLNQMHVVFFSESVFRFEHLLFSPDISLNACLCVVFCLLAPKHNSKSIAYSYHDHCMHNARDLQVTASSYAASQGLRSQHVGAALPSTGNSAVSSSRVARGPHFVSPALLVTSSGYRKFEQQKSFYLRLFTSAFASTHRR